MAQVQMATFEGMLCWLLQQSVQLFSFVVQYKQGPHPFHLFRVSQNTVFVNLIYTIYCTLVIHRLPTQMKELHVHSGSSQATRPYEACRSLSGEVPR